MSEKLFISHIENIFVSQKTRQRCLKSGQTQILETGSYVPHITGVTLSLKGVSVASLSLQTPINLNLESPTISAKELFFKELNKVASAAKELLLEATKNEIA